MMKKQLLGVLITGAVVILAAGALSIPFAYESQTLWYKVGMDKTTLRTGQLAGLLTLTAIVVQILLGTRGKLLEETFGVAALVAWHRTNGIFLCCLAVWHIALVLVPEGVANLPIGVKYWPEMVGGILFLVLVSQAISSLFRQQLGFNYKKWRAVHRVLAYLVLTLVTVHVLFVADSFSHGLPKIAFLVVVAAVIVIIAISKISRWRMKE